MKTLNKLDEENEMARALGFQNAKEAADHATWLEKIKIREIFNVRIAFEPNPDKRADLEIVREYFTNPEFRAHLEQMTWEQNQPA